MSGKASGGAGFKRPRRGDPTAIIPVDSKRSFKSSSSHSIREEEDVLGSEGDDDAVSVASSVDSTRPMDLSKDVFLFTGFRDRLLETAIRRAGGAVAVSFNSSVTVVIAKDDHQDTNKTKLAGTKGVDLITKDEFEANTGLVGKQVVVTASEARARALHSATVAKQVVSRLEVLGNIFVFTGFRDAGLEKRIRAAGGSIMPHMTLAVTVVVTKDMSQKTNKIQKAVDRGLQIIAREKLEDLLAS